MNPIPTFANKHLHRFSAIIGLLIGSAISCQADGVAFYFSDSCSYSAVEGGSFSGTVSLLRITDQFDSTWENHFSNPITTCLSIAGTGTHPIVSGDVANGDFGTCKHLITWPANNYGSQSFTITFNDNATLEYDRTGTIALTGTVVAQCQTASLTLFDNESVMNAVISSNGIYYGSWEIIRGEGSQTTTIRVIRGDTVNTRVVGITVGGNAVSGTDYTASPALGSSVTIPAGSDHVDTTITVIGKTNLVGTKILTVTLNAGAYQLSSNTVATIAIEQDVPVLNITAPGFYASQNSNYLGQFTITRSGGLSNSLVENLAIGGTATAGTDYIPLPSSIKFATNQTTTNLYVWATNAALTVAKTVVLSLTTNSTCFLGLNTNAVVTILPNGSTTNSVVSPVGRYWRGSGSDPTYWSLVVPLDYETGTVYSNLNGNCATLYSGLSSWSSQNFYHFDATNSLPQTSVANRIAFNNPLVAFGERVGGTPLYFSQNYSFGVYAGDPILSNQPVVIQVYYRTNYQLAGTVSLYPPNVANTNAWNSYTTNNFQVTTNAFGLTTTLAGAPTLNWGEDSLGSYLLTHSAINLATNYYYVVGISGNPADQSNPMVLNSSAQIAPSLLYSLEFAQRPPWRSVFLDRPHFDGNPLPPFYAGKTLAEILTNTPPVTNVVSFTPTLATNLDASPELRRHPILDRFVANLGNDPIALANYVMNEVELTDPMDFSDNGNVAEQAINPGGVTRGALATFTEKQGSPIEQCALLVYLLRQAGVPAVYEFAPRNGLQILDARLSRMLKFQVHGDINPAGQLDTTNTMIPVNYPWVAAYIGTNWVHIFPWLKDYEIVEGLDLYDYMPTNYSNAYGWVKDYIYGKTNLLSLAVNGDDTPRVIFPKYLQQTLLQNHPGVSVDDIGTHIINRRHYYSRWQDFPTPTSLTNSSTPIESLSSSTITNVNPLLTNIFDTISVEVYSNNDPTKDIKTGDMRLVDLHNREFYINQTVTNSTYMNLSLVLMPFRTNVVTQFAFSNDTNLLSKEVLSTTLDAYDDVLTVRFRYHRHRAIKPSYAIDPTLTFLGLNATDEVDIERPLRKGDQTAICLDYGRVTREMLNVRAADLWQMESDLRNNPSHAGSVSADVFEGALMYLAGMTYYEKISEFDQINERLNKFNNLSSFAAGLSKIIPARDGFGNLTNGVDPVLPCVDMFFHEVALVGNGTLRPDSGQPYLTAQQNWALLAIVDGSAEEHQVINRYYQQTNAVSTVRLLQLAQSKGTGIVPLTLNNYVAQGQTTYQGQLLQNFDPGMWQQVVSTFQDSANYGYVTAYITPGPMTNAAYKGMAALILTWDGWYALISPNSLNGGFSGQYFPPSTVAAANTTSYDLSDNNNNLSMTLNPPASQTTVMPDETASFDVTTVASRTTSGTYVLTPYETTYATYAAPSLGLASGTSASAVSQISEVSDQNRFLGTSSDAGSQTGTKVSDPVNNITGEFYADETDLQLPGPIPLALRRNYSSQNLADNQFGRGWKLSIMPYLSLSKGSTNIYAADMDGAVLAYVRSTINTNMWTPTLAANPDLANNTTAGVGGLANRLRDYILRSVNGSITNYTLYGADGSVRAFQFMKFNSGVVTNARPYLVQWTDNRGNSYTFGYDTNSADANFGQMQKIQCSNGNYLGFDYDIYGHIVDAFSGDGRWVYYDYDDFGDMVTVTLPDGSARSYVYQHSTQAVTNNSVVSQLPYSTHLMVEEDKPDGRALINFYDSQRRVTNQLSTAGIDLTPIRTATLIYSNNFALTNSFTNTITGYTLVIDGNNNTNRYDYTNSLISKITDPLGQTIQQVWFTATNAPGYYPRSVQQRIDKRGLVTQFQFDSNGNVTNSIVTGDLTGDGIASQTATNTALYNTNNLPLQITDAIGNSVAFVYDPVFTFLPQQVIRYAGSTPVSTNFMVYGNATNTVVNGNTTQTNRAFGVLTRQVRAYGSPDAATNDFSYDGHGFLTQSVNYTRTPDPAITNTFFYNERGQMVSRMDALGAVTLSDFDGLNRLTGRENFDENGQMLSWNFNYYNDNGELIWMDGPRYNPEDYIFYDYDGAGRVATEIHWRSEAKADGSGVAAPAGYNLYAQSFYQYDPLGNLTLKVDPRGAMMTNTWDALSRLVRSQHLDTNGVTILSAEGFGYEAGGKVRFYTNALGGVTETEYATNGLPEFRSNPDGSTNGWRYYLDGRIKREIQSNGAYWQTTYDDVNRITTRIFYSAANMPLATNSVLVDRRGNTIQSVDAGGNAFTATYDGLDRVKTASGPAIATVSENCGLLPGCGVYVTNILQQATTNFYDAAGRSLTNLNALSEKNVTSFDAIGRITQTKVFSASGALVRQSSMAYSSDHNSVTVTDGSGTNAISHTAYTDNDGHAVLSIAYPSANTTEFSLNQFDLAGNPITQQHLSSASGTVTTWTTATNAFDGLNRLVGKVDRDNAPTTYTYDSMGDLTNRTMPGGLQWQATYNNAGEMLQEQNFKSGNATRTNLYSYFSSGSPFAGLLQSKTDGRGVACTYSYDDWLRPTNMVYTGTLQEQQLTTSWQYEPRGYITGITEKFASTTTGPTTTILRSYDPYGQLAGENVGGGSFGYNAFQSWDAAGRRSVLNFNGINGYAYGWRADGLLAAASDPSGGGVYNYDSTGLLTNRVVSSRITTIASRDGEGRPLSITTTVNGSSQLSESLSWSGDGLLATHTLTRSDFTDPRSYTYASSSRRLIQEQLNLNASTSWTNMLAYDNGTVAGPGVLTRIGRPNGTASTWSGVADTFSRVNTETNSTFQYSAYGHANGPATFNAWLDNQPMPVTAVGTQAIQWRAMMEVNAGNHQLRVAAAHPSGQYTAWTTNSFTNAIAFQTTADSFDGAGNITQRVWLNSTGTTNRTQTLSWDARGRLHSVTERDANNSGYNWTASYDGLNRRLSTTTILVTNGLAISYQPQTINQYYDPLVEFLELGVSSGYQTVWKLYGPDLDGQYGGLNGTGGFEGVSPGLGAFYPTISDARGNILAEVTNGVVSWSPARPTGYGAVPDYRPVAYANGADLVQSSAWRGKWVDITGYHQIGLRPYDSTSGRWLTYDSVWNERDPNYYTFAGGDPINGFDADGRCANPTGQANDFDVRSLFTNDELSDARNWYIASQAMGYPTINGTPTITVPAFRDFASFLQEGVLHTVDNLMNAPQREQASYEFQHPDFGSAWGVAAWADSGISWVANTIDVGANFIPGKMLVENTIKVIAKDVTRTFTKDVAESFVKTEIKQMDETIAKDLSKIGAETEANTTRLGITRNNPADWRTTRDLWDSTGYGEILSDANRRAIANGRTPIVDAAWIKNFPEDAGLIGERIPMHHIQGTPITVPLPATRHLDAHMPGGYRYNPGGPGSALPVYPPKQ